MTADLTDKRASTRSADADVDAPARRGQRRGALARVLAPLATLAALLGIWLLVSYVLLSPDRRFLMPPPQDVAKVGFGSWSTVEPMLRALLHTFEVAMVGLLIATVIGVAWAIVMSQSRWAESALYPYAVILQTIPILAMVPLIGFWFGYGFTSRVIVCVVIALFPLVANTLFGLQSVDEQLNDLFRLHHASRWTRLVKLQLPTALPALFTGLRIAAGLSVVGAIVGDLFFREGRPGIGTLLDLYRAQLQSEQLFAAIILSSLLGVVVFAAFGILGKLVVGSWSSFGGSTRES
jgi:NitT/TauT family transport system permease protein